uniref:DUF4145 domain-containing protein n=1 Tax=Aliivibrio wodanis TaxID=80852 RepID=A0A5Q4ZSJ2_9GAMM|nr:hypothetical protein AW0309160_03528 [Aliivibrio wodanis]
MEIFIDSKVLDWGVKKFTYEEQDDTWMKCYSYLDHAERIFLLSDNHHFNSDVISNLKKAVDHRIKLISKIYNIKQLSKIIGVKGTFEVLADLGVIRKLMIGKLIEIRNSIEHQFIDAPDMERCEEYIEFVWYFLKSTDSLVKEVQSDFYFDSCNSKRYSVEVTPKINEKWLIEFSGWLPKEMYSETAQVGFFKIEVKDHSKGLDCRHNVGDDNDDYWEDLKDDDIFLKDAYVSDFGSVKKIIQVYFCDI